MPKQSRPRPREVIGGIYREGHPVTQVRLWLPNSLLDHVGKQLLRPKRDSKKGGFFACLSCPVNAHYSSKVGFVYQSCCRSISTGENSQYGVTGADALIVG